MDGWTSTYDGYDPADEGRREALCTLGNGLFATRGAFPESSADGVHYPGTYASGFYNRVRDDVDGQEVENESMVNLPNWLPLGIRVGDVWFDPDDTDLLEHCLQLDLRNGVLTRIFRFRDQVGRTTSVVQKRLVHMGAPHLAALQTTVTPEDWSGELVIRSGVDAGVVNAGVPRYARLTDRHLTDIRTGSTADTLFVEAQTTQSRLRVAVAARTRVVPHARGPSQAPVRKHLVDGAAVHHDLILTVGARVPVTVEKVVSIFTSRDLAVTEPLFAASEELVHAGGFDELLHTHRLAWDALWRMFGVEVVGAVTDVPDDFLRNVRLGLFHLLQSVSPHSRDRDAGVPARGLHGEAYRGHVFWDELFVIPQIVLRSPGLARDLLHYRYRRLPAARRAARELGRRGACFPWQSGSDGREESQQLHLNPRSGHWLPDATFRQRHVGLAVALTACRYFEATGDLEFLSDYAAELILEVVLFFADTAHFDSAKGRFVITGVVGPDEFHTGYPGRPETGIDNNAYTNVMVAWLAATALRMLDILPAVRRRELMHGRGLSAFDLARWRGLRSQMFVPFRDGIISQFEGYDDLPELDWKAMRTANGDLRRLDRLLEANGRSVNGVKASKQADVLMLLYALSLDELDEVMRWLGYEFDRSRIPAIVDYYLPRTCHGSTLSLVVHAWVLARSRRGQAVEFLLDVVHSDIQDVQRGTTAEGIHLAAMIGGADLLQRCFAGIVPRLDALEISPAWPEGLGEMTFHLRYQGHELDLAVGTHQVRVTADTGAARPVTVRCAGHSFTLGPGDEIRVDLSTTDSPGRATRAR